MNKLNNRCIRFFCFIPLILLPLVVVAAATGGEKKDPALEAIKALTEEAPETATAAEPQNVTTPGTTALPAPEATPAVTETAVPLEQAPIPVPVSTLNMDLVLVLDNSGSMKKNDPQFLASQAVREFINNLDTNTRLAVIIFDQDVRMAVPLTAINDTSRGELLGSIEQVNYKGMYTNIPDAIERAIYELKNSDRPDSKKSIIFMTDGIVDTGNAARDQEKARWLKEELAEAAKEAGIAIFGIAFTEEADFQLIQSLAQKSNGEYFRAFKPEDLSNVYARVHSQILKAAEPPPVVAPPEPPKAAEPPPPPPAPVIIEVPVQSQEPSKHEKLNTMLMFVALVVVIITVIFVVFILMRSSRRKQVDEVVAQEAYLKDIHGYTSQPSHKLGNMPTILGRTAGTDTDHMNYIVIPQTTIGRRHALIEYKDYAYWIVDQGSINGTFVNDQLITGETRLKHGDLIRLHKYEFEFSMPEMDEAGMTVVSHTMVGAGIAKAHERTVAHTVTPTPVGDVTGTSGPDFDLSAIETGGGYQAAEEDTVLKGSKTGAKDVEDETIMMDDEGTDSSDTDATLRPDDHDADDFTSEQDKPD